MSDPTPQDAVKLTAGQPFPDFALPDADGTVHRLADHAGHYVVLYAYPKDDTPGCTKEACDFRDNATLRAHGAQVLGVSRDDADSHAKFAEKYSLPFPLLSDPNAEFLRSIGAYGTKNMYGKVTEGIKRSTFLIGPDGKLVKAWYAVKVDGHADAVVNAIETDQKVRSA
ncbi:peroxiredoxin [Deinococcus maricopensis]|uniref:thioredoxin-dependent peroxiredoxin n=1 Tax=Deinococcus maricopensis (strain DSM 21211 / LMG 22137 / NRRL B-23946 / LB-34) TaxID=709986 RepID=E8UAB7_DEIML|nr:peroxiredoxin [Deinococcus maricopensis]ADV68006.1 alkyl hydroperoxide reductase/ Thiol specific antioxidant/ Mal allergen [Deinococcus maricopensis DSM 21211]